MPVGIGERLREARLGRGLELADVERVTKLRVRYLRAMEEERWEALPGEAYARGFLRTYARFLGLDAEALLEQYRASVGGPPSERGPAGTPGPAGVGRDAEGIGAPRGVGAPSDAPRRLPADGVGGTAIQIGSRRRLRALGAGPLVGFGVVALLLALLVIGLVGGDDDSPGTAVNQTPVPVEPVQPAPTPPEVEEEPTPAEPEVLSLELVPTGSVWVCLVDRRGRELVDGVTLGAGDEQGPFEARGFALTLGNAQAEISVDGEQLDLPAAPDPLGLEIGPDGVEELEPADRPTCA